MERLPEERSLPDIYTDTAVIVSGYADIIAMRHPKEGAPLVAA